MKKGLRRVGRTVQGMTMCLAKADKPRAHLADRRTIVLAEISDRLVIRSQPTREPHHLDVAPGLALKPPARLNPIEIAVDVELQQYRWMVRRPPGCLRIDPAEPKLPKIEPANKDIDRTNRIIFVNPIFQAFREQRALLAIHPLNEAPHLILPRIRSRESHSAAFSHSQGQNENSPILGLCQLLPPAPDIGLPMLPPPCATSRLMHRSKPPDQFSRGKPIRFQDAD